MSQTKYLPRGKTQHQDPEAIFAIKSATEYDENVLPPSPNRVEHSGTLETCYEDQSDENSVSKRLEYPTVTINGEPKESKMSTIHQPKLQNSKAQAFSEPDLTQADLYDHQNDSIEASHSAQKGELHRNRNPKIGNYNSRNQSI